MPLPCLTDDGGRVKAEMATPATLADITVLADLIGALAFKLTGEYPTVARENWGVMPYLGSRKDPTSARVNWHPPED